MNKRSNFVAGGVASAAICTVVLACTSSSGNPSTSTTTTPIGATEVVDAGLVGCATFEQGCFTFDGSYAAPAVTATCASPGAPASGTADTHCAGVPPQTVSAASCGVLDAGPGAGDDDTSGEGGAAGDDDAGAAPTPGPCGENGSDYGATMYGTEGKDDDCKYDVTYTAAPVCENDGTYLVVKATYLSRSDAPLTGACTFAELCLNDTHPTPSIDARPPNGKQQVVEGPPGTYTIGPVVFDQPGKWTVRFHFNELCCDVLDDSPHGHAAFFVSVP